HLQDLDLPVSCWPHINSVECRLSRPTFLAQLRRASSSNGWLCFFLWFLCKIFHKNTEA
ncbi:hypothetical protein L9F63_027132, partial [Diploptera punctata]